jgi:hypothetical protein
LHLPKKLQKEIVCTKPSRRSPTGQVRLDRMWKHNGDTVDAHKFVCCISMIQVQVKSVILACINVSNDTSIHVDVEGDVEVSQEWSGATST